jgi:hypothetical protein
MSAADFNKQLTAFVRKVETTSQAIFVNTASAAKESIVNGSSLTGAPGQPVDTGNLRNSWQLTFESPTSALISTNVEYAPFVEDNVRGVTFKNHGPHSVKLTIQNLDKIVADETAKAVGG